jgi:hypothetical protein
MRDAGTTPILSDGIKPRSRATHRTAIKPVVKREAARRRLLELERGNAM